MRIASFQSRRNDVSELVNVSRTVSSKVRNAHPTKLVDVSGTGLGAHCETYEISQKLLTIPGQSAL